MAKLITVFWRDIPAQVIGREGRKNIKKQLPTRFAEAIDRAAMRAGAASSEAYLSDWRRESRSCKSDIGKIVDEATFGSSRLSGLPVVHGECAKHDTIDDDGL